MNRELLFRYTYRRKDNGRIWQLFFSIQEIEEEKTQPYCMRINQLWDLIARDQWTGLQDKNGKDIFEGDILTRPINPKITLTEYEGKKIKRWLHVAEWDRSGFVFRSLNPYPWNDCISIPYIHSHQVIGDIYQDHRRHLSR